MADQHEELTGLYRAIEVVEERISALDERGRQATASAGDAGAHAEAGAAGAHRELVGVRDALYERVVRLGGQWPSTEAGRKQPPHA